MASIASFVVVIAVAAAATAAAVPVTTRLALRAGANRAPAAHHIHTEPTPLAGGAAMMAGLIAAAAASAAIGDLPGPLEEPGEFAGVVAAAALMFAVGFVDDVRGVCPPAKLAAMASAAGVMHLAGVAIVVFRIPFYDLLFLSSDLSVLMTVMWVVGMANVVNLIDGLDGLAAGIVAIASATLLLYALRLGDEGIIDAANPGPLWAAISLGVCAGFLPYNVYPARVFMGDGGTLLLGTLTAASTMSLGGRSTAEFSGQAFFFYAPLFIPLLILGVPVLDTAFAILRRTLRGRMFAAADREHLHHRLMSLGHGHRRSVLILWLWTALLSGFVLYPTYTGRGDGLVPAGIGALALMLFTLFHPRFRPEEAEVDEAELDRLNRL